MSRRIGVVGIVNEIAIDSVPRSVPIVSVDEDGMVDVENWKIREVGDEKFATRKRSLQFFMGFHLIIFVVKVKHADVTWAQISNPAQTDVPLHQKRLGRAQFAQISIPGYYDPLFRRQWSGPGRFACNGANAFAELLLIQFRRVRFKARELIKLRDGAGHHETAARVVVAELVLVRNDVAVLIRKHGPVGEGKRIAVILETISRTTSRGRQRQ